MADGWTDFTDQELQQAAEAAAAAAMSGFEPGGQDFGAPPPDTGMPPESSAPPVVPGGYDPGTQEFGATPPPLPANSPLVPAFNDIGGLMGVSAGYSMGPGNEATGQKPFGDGLPKEQRFGDATADMPWAIEGARPLGPTMEAIARSEKIGADLDRRGTNFGPMLGSALNRMGEIEAVNMRGGKYTPEFQQNYEQGWVDNGRNNNLLTVRPEKQADGSINQVFTYESGRQESRPYQAAPPKPAYGGGGGQFAPPKGPPWAPADLNYRGPADEPFRVGARGGGALSGEEVPVGSIGGGGWRNVTQAGSLRGGAGEATIPLQPGDRYITTPNGVVIERNGQLITVDPKTGRTSQAPAPASQGQKIERTPATASPSASPTPSPTAATERYVPANAANPNDGWVWDRETGQRIPDPRVPATATPRSYRAEQGVPQFTATPTPQALPSHFVPAYAGDTGGMYQDTRTGEVMTYQEALRRSGGR